MLHATHDERGGRELRQRTSELLHRAESGKTIEVTDRGRPVAVLGPPPAADPIERLRLTGDLRPAEKDMNDLPEPLQLGPEQEAPSAVLSRLRADER